jgi:general stress protein CsbA
VRVAAIAAVAAMVIAAVLKGIDSKVVLVGIMVVSGLAGYIIANGVSRG